MKKTLLTAVLAASLLPSLAQDYVPTLYGNLIWDDYMTSDYDSRIGVYSFPASANLELTPLVTSPNLYANGNGVMDGKNYYEVTYYDYDGEHIYQIYNYNMDTWQLNERPVDVSITETANDFTYDSKNGKYYGIMNTANANGNQLCEIDFTTKPKPSRIVLADIPDDSTLYTLSADADGTLYSITGGGNLVTIDEEGNITKKGSLNLSAIDRRLYERIQSAAFDPKTGLLYWAAQLWDTKNIDLVAELYSINVKTLELKKIANFPDNAQIVSLYVVPPAANDGAPAAATNLGKNFDGFSLSGNITFTAPTKTYDGKGDLTGELTYTVSDSAKVLATGTTQPSAQVSAPVTVEKDGLTRFEVKVNNAAGEGAPAVFRSYIGHDKTSLAKNVKMTIADGKAHITWDAPDSTLHGGYYDPTALKYDVVRYSSASLKRPAGTDLTTNETDVDLPTNRWAKYYFTVIAKNGTQQADEAASNDMAYGPTKEVPYSQKFSGTTSFNEFTAIDANNDKEVQSYPDFGISFSYGFWDYSSQRKAAIYHPSSDNAADDWLLTPQINFKGGNYYKVEFDAWRELSRFNEQLAVAYGPGYDVNNYNVIKNTFNPDTLALDSVTGTTSPTHYTVYFKPDADLAGAIAFHTTSPAYQGLIYVTNLNITATTEEEALTNGITTVSAARILKTGNVYDINGRLVRRAGQSLSGLPKGIYIIDGKKYVVR